MGAPERIAVTGLGIVSALGPDAPATFRQIGRGVRGFAPVTLFDVSGQRSAIAAQVRGLSARDVAPAAERLTVRVVFDRKNFIDHGGDETIFSGPLQLAD